MIVCVGQNHLVIASVKLPSDDAQIDASHYVSNIGGMLSATVVLTVPTWLNTTAFIRLVQKIHVATIHFVKLKCAHYSRCTV